MSEFLPENAFSGFCLSLRQRNFIMVLTGSATSAVHPTPSHKSTVAIEFPRSTDSETRGAMATKHRTAMSPPSTSSFHHHPADPISSRPSTSMANDQVTFQRPDACAQAIAGKAWLPLSSEVGYFRDIKRTKRRTTRADTLISKGGKLHFHVSRWRGLGAGDSTFSKGGD